MTRAASLVLAALALLAPAAAEARPRGSAASAPAIVVDVSRLRALGLGATADRLQAAIARELAAGGVAGTRFSVRLTGFSLASYAGADGPGSGGRDGGGGGGVVDYVEGDYQVLGPGGEILAQRSQVSSSPASSGGAYYLPGAEERRIDAAGRTFALWIKRSVD